MRRMPKPPNPLPPRTKPAIQGRKLAATKFGWELPWESSSSDGALPPAKKKKSAPPSRRLFLLLIHQGQPPPPRLSPSRSPPPAPKQRRRRSGISLTTLLWAQWPMVSTQARVAVWVEYPAPPFTRWPRSSSSQPLRRLRSVERMLKGGKNLNPNLNPRLTPRLTS